MEKGGESPEGKGVTPQMAEEVRGHQKPMLSFLRGLEDLRMARSAGRPGTKVSDCLLSKMPWRFSPCLALVTLLN